MVSNVMNTSVSALNAYSTMLNNTASNVANSNTEPYKPLETTMQDSSPGGVTALTERNENVDSVDLSQEAVNSISAENGFSASIKVLETAQQMQKSVIDIIV